VNPQPVSSLPFVLLVLAIAMTALVPAGAQERPPNPAFQPIEDSPDLPRVLLIGDSISVGYTVPVRELLEGKANVHRIPENGGPTTKGLRSIDEWLGEKPWDVIHFNWGLHDLKIGEDEKHQVPLDEYGENLLKLVERLEQTEATLIWASTTPVPEGNLAPARSDADTVAYNEAAKSVMDEHEIAIDDLYAFALPRLEEIQRPENVHFKPKGSKALAEEVAKSIESALEDE